MTNYLSRNTKINKMGAAALTYRLRVGLDYLMAFCCVVTVFILVAAEELHGKLREFYLPSVFGILVAAILVLVLVLIFLAITTFFSSKLEREELVYILQNEDVKQEEILNFWHESEGSPER